MKKLHPDFILADPSRRRFVQGLASPIEMLPVLADVIGIVSIAALAVSIPSGYLRAKDALGRARYVHTWLGITLAVVLAAHGLVGVLHTLSG